MNIDVQWGSQEEDFQPENLWSGIEQLDDSLPQYSPDYYFDSYAHFGIHEEMIKDSRRTDAYRHAILRNPHIFADKIVLDIGCGTGILSFFAARAGAAHVYGIECANIVDYTREIVRLNGMQDKITIIKGKVEEVELPVPQVDIIISEWMGYFLLYESMLDTVLFARDKWLKPGGLMFPDKARLWIAGIEDAKYKHDKIEFWNRVYNIDMTAMRRLALFEPLVDNIDMQNIITNMCPVIDFDLQTVTKPDLEFVSSYSLHINRKDFLHGIVGWFEVGFFHCHKHIILSTSPKYNSTHWKHVIFYLDNPVPVDSRDMIYGSLAVRYNRDNPRELDVKISYNLDGERHLRTSQFYRIR